MPVVAKCVLEGGTVSCSPGKSSGFEGQRIGLWNKTRPKRMIPYYHPVGIATEFCSGCAVLQVIFSVMLGHPGTFYERIQECVVHIFSESLPAISPVFQGIHFLAGPDRLEGFPVQFNAIEGVAVAAAIVHIQPSVLIQEEIRVPASNIERINERLPLIVFRVGAHPDGKIPGVGGPKDNHRIPQYGDSRGTEFIIPLVPGPQKFPGHKIPVQHVAAPPVSPLVG